MPSTADELFALASRPDLRVADDLR